MSRIADRFANLRHEERKGFIPFVTAGDPDAETSLAVVKCLADLGADVIELGVPFSDPMADGPTIQRSSQRSLKAGTDLRTVLDLAKAFRQSHDTPIVLFSYLNPLLRYGFDRLVADALNAGLDGFLITDAVDDEASAYGRILAGSDIDLISLIAPTTTDERLKKIASNSDGFLYAISRAGVTGAVSNMGTQAETLVSRVRSVTDLPVAVGFGISSREQITDVWRYADAAVVGSAIVSVIEESANFQTVERVEDFVRGLLPEFAKSNSEL